MADEQENIKLQFDTNAKAAMGDVNKLAVSIDQTTEATEAQNKEVGKGAEQFKSYKQQLKEAVIEQQKLAQQYGATSAEATKAAQKVAGITDEMQFQKDLAKSYNPDEKFRALTQTAGIAALALGGVKDGFTALGIESKTLDKIIGSAQAILGVTSAVAAMSDAYAVLTASKKAKSAADVVEVATTEAVAVAEVQATAATWSWTAALLANPIVAITAGIIAAGVAVYAFTKIMSDSVSEEEKAKVASMQLSEAIDHQAKQFENNSKFAKENNNHKIALLRASGASEAQIYKETKALAEQELQLAKNFRAEATLSEQKAYESNRDNPTEFNAKTLANAKENLEKAKQAVSVGYDGLIDLQKNHEVAVVQAATDARKKAQEDAEKAREKEIEDEKKKQEKLISDKKSYLEKANAVDEEFANLKFEKDQEDKKEKEKEYEEGLELQAQKAQDAADVANNLAEEEKRRQDAITQNKQDNQDRLVSQGENLLNNVKTLAGKNKQIQKAAIIADGAVGVGKAVASTAEAVTKDLAKGFPISVPLVALDVAVGATSIASIVQGTNKALQAVGGGSISGGSVQAAPRSAAPQVAFNNTAENQIGQSVAKTQAEQPPLQVNVLESDITKAQGNVKVLVKTNTF